MTVLSKQYSLIDLINLRVKDKDNGFTRSRFNANSLVYNRMYQLARTYPNMTYDEFEDYYVAISHL